MVWISADIQDVYRQHKSVQLFVCYYLGFSSWIGKICLKFANYSMTWIWSYGRKPVQIRVWSTLGFATGMLSRNKIKKYVEIIYNLYRILDGAFSSMLCVALEGCGFHSKATWLIVYLTTSHKIEYNLPRAAITQTEYLILKAVNILDNNRILTDLQ